MSGRVLMAVARPPEWVAAAVCAQVDPELFYPDKGGSVRDAKRVCTRCPVRPQCLAYALDGDERHGVWGGLSEPERRRRARAAATDPSTSQEADHQVDGVVVARLIAGHPVAGATRTEQAHAAIDLHRDGLGAPRIAARLGVPERQVQRWVTRHRSGTPLTPRAGHRPRTRQLEGAA